MQVTLSLVVPADKATIKSEIDKFEAEIKVRQSEIEIYAQAIRHYQKQCKHPGQVTGYNDRDGSWGNPCKICGYSF